MVAPLTFTNGSQLTTSEQLAEVLYVAYLGRAGDPTGVTNWIDNLNNGSQTIDQEAISFGQSTEADNLYPFLANPIDAGTVAIQSFVTEIYQNLFDRAPDAPGLAYWTAQLEGDETALGSNPTPAQTLTFNTEIADFTMDVVRGAQNSAAGQDITTLMDKVTVANYFTNVLNEYGITYVTAPNSLGYNPVLDAIGHLIATLTDSGPTYTVAAEESFINFVFNSYGPVNDVNLDQGSIPGTPVALNFSGSLFGTIIVPALTYGTAAVGTQSNVSITGFVSGDELILQGTGGAANVTVASVGTNVDIAYTDNSAAQAEHQIQLVGVLTAGQHPTSVAQFDALFFGGILAA